MEIDQRSQIGIVVFCTVVSLMLTAMLPVLVPTYDATEDSEKLADERMSLAGFTGESMLSKTPFKLTHVYTPYVFGGAPVSMDDSWGVDMNLYGEDVAYSEIGKTDTIRLDPEQKSVRFLESTKDTVIWKTYQLKDWATDTTPIIGDLRTWWHEEILGEDPRVDTTRPQSVTTWNYTGYRYVFQPETKVGGVDTDMLTVSLIWYRVMTTEGIVAGLVMLDGRGTYLANYTATEIAEEYKRSGSYASKYTLNFDILPVTMAIRFDKDVLDSTTDLMDAFSEGRWTMAIYAASIDNFLDVDTSNNYSMSIGGMIDTYQKILTLSYPDIGGVWNVILWIICSLPLMLVLMNTILAVINVIKPGWF